MPVPPVRRVDGEFRRVGRNFHATRDQQEFPGTPVQNEDVNALVERQNQRGLGAVDHEARSTLRRARLEEGGDDIVAARANRKDGSDRDVVFEVGRSVERIDGDTERRLGIEHLRQIQFLGQDSSDRGGA